MSFLVHAGTIAGTTAGTTAGTIISPTLPPTAGTSSGTTAGTCTALAVQVPAVEAVPLTQPVALAVETQEIQRVSSDFIKEMTYMNICCIQ